VDSICQYFIPSVLAGFYQDFPDVPISVTVADTRQCIEAIRQQRADLAIAIAPSQAEALEMQPLFADELHWIVSPTHPWALNDQFRPGDIASQRLVFSAASSHTFRLVEKYYERDNLHLKPAVELDNYEATKEMVKAGHGVTVMATWMAGKELADGTLVALPLGRHKLKRNWCILQSPDSRAGLAEEVFSRHCHQTALSFGASPFRQSLAKKFIHASCAAILLISDWSSSVGDLLCLTGAV
jgi:LysR family transcriptional regulator, low CO2-responsive transcriptional regulator